MNRFFLLLACWLLSAACALLPGLSAGPASATRTARATTTPDPPPCVGTRAELDVPARSITGQPARLTLRLVGPGVLVSPVLWEPSHVLVDELRTGGATLDFTYPSKGSHLVLVRAQVLQPDASTPCSVWARTAVRVVDDAPPPLTVTVSCDAWTTHPGTPVTCSASTEGVEVHSPQWIWSCGSAVDATVTCAWSTPGVYPVTARVRGIGPCPGLGVCSGTGSTSVEVVALPDAPAPPTSPPGPPPAPTEPAPPVVPLDPTEGDGSNTCSVDDLRQLIQRLRDLLDSVDGVLADVAHSTPVTEGGAP